MHKFARTGIVLLLFLASVFGLLSTASAQDAPELNVNVIGCVDAACENTVDIFTMDGATVTSYDAAGAVVDSCTVSSAADDFDGCLLAPAPEGGSYDIVAPAGYEGYTLFSDSPEIFESPDRGTWVWYFLPPVDGSAPEAPYSPAEAVAVNVIICVDPDCVDTVNIETMFGATVSSYMPDGSPVDSCIVTMVVSQTVCNLIPPPDGGWYEIEPAAEYAGYVLLSETPEIFESEMHGPIYVWYFAPEKDNAFPPPTQAPAAPAKVTGLPRTGSGADTNTAMLAVIAAVPFALAGAALIANRATKR
jgi:hypothetical protein